MEKPTEKQEKEQTQASQQESKTWSNLRGKALEEALRSLMSGKERTPIDPYDPFLCLGLERIFKRDSERGE